VRGSPDTPAVEIHGLEKAYGDVRALRGVDLTIERGQFFGLLGPNGAGKSTTIHIVTGLVTFSTGEVRVFGRDVVSDYRYTRRRIGLAPQEFNFDRFFPIRDILVLNAGYYGIARDDAERRADELLDRFGLASKADQKIHKLSGGMKRRLLIAKAMIHEPDLLILDEPTAGVDVELRRGLWRTLRGLNERGITVLLTTHYIEEAEALCEEVAIIDDGEIVAQGSPRHLIETGGDRHLEVHLTCPPSGPLPEPIARRDPHVAGSKIVIAHHHPRRIAAEVLAALYEADMEITEVKIVESSLEEVFVRLTGHGIDQPGDEGHPTSMSSAPLVPEEGTA